MKPLFMWAGGKTKVMKHYAPFMPQTIKHYYEPFVGGGAMFVNVMKNYTPKRVFLNDTNEGIISIYKSIRDDYDRFVEVMDSYQEVYLPLDYDARKAYYFQVRDRHAWDYHNWDKTYEAATLYFLMKTGFNGIWQINKNTNGRFGTPAGLLNQTDKVYDKDVVKWWHDKLQDVELYCGDWRIAVQDDPDGFFFLDPPYRNSFTKYGTGWDDQDLLDLISFANTQKSVFLCNRADDDWFDTLNTRLNVHYFPITYTAGRRKKTNTGYAAKKARECLLYM